MAKQITRVISGFDALGRATLTIPNGSESVALRFYETDEIGPDPMRLGAKIAVILLVDVPRTIPGNHMRHFMLIPNELELPDNFIKYVATFPRGPNKQPTHIIEVGA